jgi:uncharacterized protein YukJ
MPIQGYGVLTAQVVDRRREGSGDTPHYQVHLKGDDGTDYRVAVNVKSQQAPSDLLYLLDDDFQHPVTAAVDGLGAGWHPLPAQRGGPNLDYVRANLFDAAKMHPLPPDAAGPDNDLPDLLEHYVQRAIADPAARLHVFGQRWGPEEDKKDKSFGFLPGNGVHDVHMNQGNSGQFVRDDGVFQDGGLLFHFPAESRWVGVFLAFQSQAFHTDDTTGHALDVPAPEPGRPGPVPPVPEQPEVQIIAAMVNPPGPGPEQENVSVINLSPEPVDMTGWQLADRQQHTMPVPAGSLASGEVLRVFLLSAGKVSGGMQLGNHGGTITLLNAAGLKVSGVAYTEQQAQREGWTIAF